LSHPCVWNRTFLCGNLLLEGIRPLHMTPTCTQRPKETPMLWTIFVILLVLWLLGLVSSYTLGGFIHLLLIIAVVVLVIQLIQGRRSPPL